MSTVLGWKAQFPVDTAAQVVKLLADTWQELCHNNTHKFNVTSDEPHLSQFLQSVVKTKAGACGLTGQFSAERVEIDANLKTGALENRKRTDICYFSDRFTPSIHLVFEFKKLKPVLRATRNRSYNASHEAYCNQGISRFVNGEYSKDQPLAFMVGMVDPIHKVACLAGIQAAMSNNSELQMTGSFVQPSALFPELSEFDSLHARNLGLPPITLSHLFLVYSQAQPQFIHRHNKH